MNPLPFTVTDGVFTIAFGSYLGGTLSLVVTAVAAPLSATIVLWIIIQGILVMRGDLDTRRGVTRIVKVVIVYALVAGGAAYTETVQNWFTTVVPNWIAGVTTNLPVIQSIPIELDILLQLAQQALENIAAQIGTGNNTDESSYQLAKTVLYGTLFTIFALYEVARIMTEVLVAIGPLFLIGYLFDATRQIAERWIGQLVNYAVLLLLIFIVGTIVITTEVAYITLESSLITVLTPLAGQISDFYDLDIFLLTGDFIVLAVPIIAGAIGGGINASRSETGYGGLGGGGQGFGGFGRPSLSGGARQLPASNG